VTTALIGATPTWERWVVLAPVLVVGAGLVAGVLILLGRGLVFSIRESGHSRWIYVGLAALCGVIGVLTYLGVSLPRE
jgi:hypothetical protein